MNVTVRTKPRLEIAEAGERWRWRYVGDGTVILANRTFPSLEEAARSARRAYPEVPAFRRIRPPISARPWAVAAVAMAALVVAGIAWRNRAGPRRSR